MIGMRMRTRAKEKSRTDQRRGTAAVEFALVAPLFILLVFGIIEFGRMLMVQQVLTNATREGARRAIVEGTTQSEVLTVVNNYLSNSSVSDAAVTVNPSALENAGFADPVVISVSVQFDSVSWLPSPWFLKDTTLSASSTMQAERLQ